MEKISDIEQWLGRWALQQLEENRTIYDMEGHQELVELSRAGETRNKRRE